MGHHATPGRMLDAARSACFALGAVSFAEADSDRAPSDWQPEILGAYELLIELASGGMATVHLARARGDRHGSSLVAIKRPHRHLAADRGFLTMLVDEARLASAIRHENVVRVRELGFEGGVPFIAMDYVEGASLAELRRELAAAGRTIDPHVALRVAIDMLAGLSAAHALRDDVGRPRRIVHRDVSPHNVLLGTDGRTRLTDFGIAKAEDRIQTTRTHEVKGKLAYLAPERVDQRRICTVQSDVFSAGLVLWECIAGRRVFQSEHMVDLLQEVMTAPIPRLGEIGAPISRELDDVIARALSRDLETRYPTADAFSRAIVSAAGEVGIGGPAEVARLIEAVFGRRTKARQDRIRELIGDGEQADLPHRSGVRNGDDHAAPVSSGGLARRALPSPMTQSVVDPMLIPPPRRSPRWLGTAAGLAAGVALGIASMWPAERSSRVASGHGDPAVHEPSGEAIAAPPVASSALRRAGLSAPPAPAPDTVQAGDESLAARPAAPRSTRPLPGQPGPTIGTLRDGFTKLK
jgi:serine/threonine protein kinase